MGWQVFGFLAGISIHAPVKGATLPKGSRNNILDISIHAPVKGATRETNTTDQYQQFQSTLP